METLCIGADGTSDGMAFPKDYVEPEGEWKGYVRRSRPKPSARRPVDAKLPRRRSHQARPRQRRPSTRRCKARAPDDECGGDGPEDEPHRIGGAA